jgi:hypothetical protein
VEEGFERRASGSAKELASLLKRERSRIGILHPRRSHATEDVGADQIDLDGPLEGAVQDPVQVQDRARIERL